MHCLNFQYVEDTENKPRYTDKAPERIMEDYLELVFEHLMSSIEIFSADLLRCTPVDVVALAPAVSIPIYHKSERH
jgi:hypothetical protein